MTSLEQEIIQADIERIERILATDIFARKNSQHPLLWAAFIEVILCLRDLVYKTEKYASRIEFTNDIMLDPTLKIHDVTDLITYVRRCISHPETEDDVIDQAVKLWIFPIYGKGRFQVRVVQGTGEIVGITDISGNFQDFCHLSPEQHLVIHDMVISSDYENEVAFCVGTQRIYLHRHIERALNEAKELLYLR